MNENQSFAGAAIAVLILGLVGIVMLLFSGCVINNENIIQLGEGDTMQQEEMQEQSGSLEATLTTPIGKL